MKNIDEKEIEKELDNWRHNHFHGRRDKDASGEYLERSSQLDLAKHFVEWAINKSSIDYNKLNKMLEEALSKETKESWNKFIDEEIKEEINNDLDEEIYNEIIKLHTAPCYDELRNFAYHFVNWKNK